MPIVQEKLVAYWKQKHAPLPSSKKLTKAMTISKYSKTSWNSKLLIKAYCQKLKQTNIELIPKVPTRFRSWIQQMIQAISQLASVDDRYIRLKVRARLEFTQLVTLMKWMPIWTRPSTRQVRLWPCSDQKLRKYHNLPLKATIRTISLSTHASLKWKSLWISH